MRVSSFSYDMLGAEAGLAAGDGGDYAGFLAGTREGGRREGWRGELLIDFSKVSNMLPSHTTHTSAL
jgi:hypothetical protein